MGAAAAVIIMSITFSHWCQPITAQIHAACVGSQCPVASLPVCGDGDVVVLQTEQLGLTLGNPAACSVPGSSTVSLSLLQFMSIKSVMPSNHLILCHPFSSCQSFPASGSFQMNQFFTSGAQNIGASASASVLPMSIQG